MDINKCNEIMARECGVSIVPITATTTTKGFYLRIDTKVVFHEYYWTIVDARCREIIRDHFGIETMRRLGSTGFHTWEHNSISRGKGKTIAEAEIACIIEICKHD